MNSVLISNFQRTTERLHDGANYRIEYVYTWGDESGTYVFTYALKEYEYVRGVWLLCKNGFRAFDSECAALDRGMAMVRELEGSDGEA